ncbi:hypothetical protein [Streptomyces sp. NPDC002790]|uniref:hypothetical protein n=1 Tax=Streptomyces sp. NPDC002790 TaxID=3154431 RepID=UPI00332E0500
MNDAESEDRLLMAAVTGEPLPEDDPAVAAVVADVALLREQVRGLGDALASRREPVPVPVPVRSRRRPLRLAFGGLAVACAASLFGGLVWLGVSAPGGGGDADSGSDKAAAQGGGKAASSPAMRIACSRVLVEGRVTSVTPHEDGDVRVVLDVSRYYRPERSVREHPTIAVMLDASAHRDLKPGTYTLIRVPTRPGDREEWTTGHHEVAAAREDIARAGPGARGLTCE